MGHARKRRSAAAGRIHDDDAAQEDESLREKILRGSRNVGAPPELPSASEEGGDVRHGRVVSLRGRETVVVPDDGGEPAVCILRKSTRVPHAGANAIAIGDRVRFLSEGEPPHVLTEVEARRTTLQRTRRGRAAHVIAANVDLCVIVASAEQPSFKPRLVDRYLISAREGGLEPVLVLNKTDLIGSAALERMLAPYAALEIAALGVSAETGEGIDALRDLLKDRTSVFSGQSGVGKSSLLNRLIPGARIQTSDVYGKEGKGRHTTSASTLYEFPFGGDVIDTPGIRSFLLSALSLDSLNDFFPEIASRAEACRFSDCGHAGDQGCALPDAIRRGDVLEDRLDSYRTLRREIESAR